MYKELEKLYGACFPQKPWMMRDFADLKKSGCEFFIRKNGFIAWRTVPPEAEIITIGVHPNSRRMGIAKAMLAKLEKELKALGIEKIFLEVAENNAPALTLYEKNGYKKVGTRPNYYDTIAAILMKKDL